MSTRRLLSSILPAPAGGGDDILDQFDAAAAAADLAPLPRGAYTAVAVAGGLTTARTGTPGYAVEFRVAEGDHAGRQVWKTYFLTPAALPYSKRDLAKLGLTSRAMLEAPFPVGRLVCRLALVVRTRDDGTASNEVKDVTLLRVQEPEADPFAPAPTGDAAEPSGGGDAGFAFGAEGGVG